jgi:hypothetical protein
MTNRLVGTLLLSEWRDRHKLSVIFCNFLVRHLYG